jgi:3-dehydroquinate synthase
MRNLCLKLQDKEYQIKIEKGLLNRIGKEVRSIYDKSRIAVITDKTVNQLYGKSVVKSLEDEGFNVSLLELEPGEKTKSIENLTLIYEFLINSNINRSSLLIGLGGGVIGDISGYAASTFLRGIPFVQIPTTLLAQVDSSVGGKVAVNLPQGKNLVGSFYHPKAVFIDTAVLSTLSAKFFADGLGEVIKYGAIKDEELFRKLIEYRDLEELKEDLEYIVSTCVDIKRKIVQEDEKEQGDRMLLNFGHTLGHAIEKYFNYESFSHGEAVSIGMYYITCCSEAVGITEKGTAEKLKGILAKYDLPHSLPESCREQVLKNVKFDKKSMDSGVNLVLLIKIGNSFYKEMPNSELSSFWNAGGKLLWQQ